MSYSKWSEDDKAYLAAFYESDGPELMAEIFKCEKRKIVSYFYMLRRKNQLNYYKRKWYEGTANEMGRD